MSRYENDLVVALVATAALLFSGPLLAKDLSGPQIKVVPLDSGNQSYLSLLKGSPETKSLHAGLVILSPGKSVGVHSTGTNEEMLVPLEGEGELRFSNHPSVHLRSGLITYAPPHTEHDAVNTGSVPLRYIYITARAE